MQSEEEKRRLQLYLQQVPSFTVKTGPSRTPQPTAQPNIPIKVSQPQAPVTPITQPQPVQDKRPFWSKVADQINPFDQGRTFTNIGPKPEPTWAQRNINALTVPKITKEIAQGLAQTPIVMTQGLGEITKGLASNKDAQKALAMPYEQRKAIISASTGNWLTDRNNPLNFYNPNYAVAKFFQETKIEPTDENIKKYIQGQEEYKKAPITFQPTSRLQKIAFGEKPVTSYQQAGKDIAQFGAEKTGQKWINKLAPGLAIGMFALDLPSKGFSGAFNRTIIKQLVKEEAPDVIANIVEKQGVKLAEEEIQALARATTEQEVKSIVKAAEDRVASEVAQTLAKTTEQAVLTTPVAKTATEAVAKAVPTPTAAVTAEQVKNLLQGLPETSRTQFADELAKAVSPEEVKTVITKIEDAKQGVTKAVEAQVPEALPVTPLQRQQEALAKAVEQPTAPVREVAPTPVTQTPVQPIPTAVQGAVSPEVAIKNAINQSSFENDLAQYNLTPEEVATVGFTKSDFDKGKAIVNNAIKQIENAKTTDEIIRIANNAQNQLGKLNITETLKKQLADFEVYQRQKLIDAQKTIPMQAVKPQDIWDEQYVPLLETIDNQVNNLRRELTSARGQDKVRIQTQIDALNKQSAALENDFLSKYGKGKTKEVAQIPTQAVTPPQNKIGIQNINDKTVFYHGTQGPINQLSELNESYGTLNNLFGPGIYLTDNPNIASGYQTTRGTNVQAGKVLSGTISDAKLFNLENTLPKDLADIFRNKALQATNFPEEIPDFSKMSGVDAIREIKKYIGDQYEFDDFFTQEVQPLLQTKGFDGFYHIGGVQGGPKHNVAILFDTTKIKDLPSTQVVTPPPSRFAIKETPEQVMARLRARQAEIPVDQARIGARDVAERQALSERQAFVALPTTDFVERLAEQTGISPKWLRRAVDKGYGKDWVYTTALDSVQGAEDVNKVFNNRVKNIKFGVLPAEKNLSPLIGKRVTFKDGTIGKVLDTNTDSTRIQVEMPDGSVRVDVKKSDLQPRGVIEQSELLKKVKDYQTEEGRFSEYSLGDMGGQLTVHEGDKGYTIRNIDIPEEYQRLGIGSNIYRMMNQQSLANTGEPLMSTKPRVLDLSSGKEQVWELSDKAKGMWNKLVEAGEAIQNPDGTYQFTKIQLEPEIIKQEIPKVTDINAPLSDTVIVNGNIVNKVTGEVLEPPKPIVKRIVELPNWDKATIQDFDSILKFRDDAKKYIDDFIKVNGREAVDKLQEDIFLLDKKLISESVATPRSMELRNNILKPFTDALQSKSKRAGEMGVREYYLPQLRKTFGEPLQVEFGYSTIDKANTTFGSAETRKGINELQDLAPIEEQLKNYIDQWTYDNYNQIATASKPEYANTYIDPVKYLNDEEKIIEQLAVKADQQVADIKKSVVPSDTMTIDAVTENFQKHALPEIKKTETIDINGRLPRGTSLLEDREILQGLGVYDKFGFKAYDEANVTAAQIYQDNIDDILKMNKEQIQERLNQLFAKQFTEMPESTDYVIRKRANAIFNDLNNSRKNVQMGIEPEVTVPAYHFAKLEKDLAAAKIYYNLQRSNIKDEGVKKLLNRQLEKTLTDNRRIETFGEKILNGISETLHTAMLGLKIPTAVQNLTETLRLTGILDDDILKEVYQEAITGKLNVKETLQRIGQDRSVLKQLSDIPTNQQRITASNLLDKTRNFAMAGFDATEGIKDTIFLRGFELQGRKRGLSGRELGQYIAENYNKYAFKGGQFGSLGFNQNPVGRLLFQFSQYPIKQIKLNARYAKQALSTDPVVRNQALRYLGRTFGTNAAAAAVLYPVFGWGMQRALGLDLPKFGPTVSLTVELYNVINDEIERVNNENDRLAQSGSNERVGYDWNNVLDRWGRKVAAYPIPGGDWLFNKLGVGELLPDGYNPFSKNTTIATWQRGYEENYKGQARIEGPQNWYDYATQAIGGQYNTAAARGYFGNTPFSFTIDIPGTAADIRIFSKDRLKPLNKAEQQIFDNLKTTKEKIDFLTQKHKNTKLYQSLKKEFGDNLDAAIFGPTYTNTQTGERVVLDSKEKAAAKARLLLTVPGLLEAVNMINAESPLPIKDPFLNLTPEHQKQFLRYQASEDYQKKAIYEQNKDWIQPFMDARDPYFAQFELIGEQKKQQKDQFGLMPPELTDNIKSLRDRYFQLQGWEARSQFLADNPSLQTYLKEKDKYDRNYNTLSYRPNIDPYPEADAETQKYLDEYTASGPAKTDTRKATERSAWIKANPEKWKKVQAFFTASAMWSLQNELALSVYEGIDPTEKALKDIMSLAKGMGLGQFGYGTGGVTPEDTAYKTIMSNLAEVSAKGIGLDQMAKPRRLAKFKVKVPTSRRTKQIRLR